MAEYEAKRADSRFCSGACRARFKRTQDEAHAQAHGTITDACGTKHLIDYYNRHGIAYQCHFNQEAM